MSESGFTRKFVFPAEGIGGLTTDTGDARYARNPIIRTGGTDARSHEDHFGDTGKNPADYGTVGKDILTDDTVAIQAAINWFKNPDTTNVPGTAGFRSRVFRGRVLNLAGGTYGISSTLNFDNAQGMSLCNGTLVAIGSGWGSSPMLQGDLGLGMTAKELTLECNGLANGILANRCVHSAWQDINIWGCGTESYGFSSTTASAGLLMKLNRVSVYGTIAAETVATSGYTATGFLLSGGSDCSMQNCETNRVLVGAHISGGGWRIINCHFTGSGDAAVQNDVGLKLEAGQYNQVIGCNFDHSILYLRGVGRRLVSGCMFRSDTADKLTCAVQWEATAAAQLLSGAIIVDNYSSLTGDVATLSGIELIETGGNSFDGVDRLVIGRNLSQQQSALLPKPKTTFGTTDVNVIAGVDWSDNVVNINMSDILLHPMPPTHGTRLTVSAAAQPDDIDEGASFMGAVYDRATALLSLTFSQPFSGRIRVDYQWGDQYERLNAEAPA